MKQLSTRLIIVAFAATLALGASAYAQGGPGGGGGSGGGQGMSSPRSGAMDRDMDRMRDMDKDMDRDRMHGRAPLYLGAKDRIRAHDRDGDGQLDRNEFNAWRSDAFDAMNGGEGFTLEQYLAVRLGPGPYGASNAARQQEMQERANLRKTERFHVMDGNGDGVVTRGEFMKFGEMNYLEADANDDGKVSVKELQQYNRGM